jgi:hypothetical protein
MFKALARLEYKIGDKLYHLTCDHDSPLSEVKEALTQFLGHCVSAERAALDAQNVQKAADELAAVQPEAEQAKEEVNG